MGAGLDLVLADTAQPGDGRLDQLLLSRHAFSRIIAVVGEQSSSSALTPRLEESGVPWLSVTGTGDAAAVNRALLLCERDALIVPGGVTLRPACVEELIAVSRLHDRIAAVAPMTREASSHQGDEAWLRETGLPPAVEIPAPDANVLLVRREVVQMAGGLDPRFPSLAEALADFCLRAQRLGFLTLRALRALAETSRSSTVAMPASHALHERHANYAFQRKRAEEGYGARLTHQALSLRRGGPSVCLDIRYLPEDAINGTGVYAVELCRALREHTPARVSLLVATEAQRRSVAPLGAPVYVEGQHVPGMDLVHRPAQVFHARDLPWLLSTPAPFVITFQDLIAYRAASAFPTPRHHDLFQVVSHLALRSAQAVVAISQHNCDEIVREFHLPREAVHVVHHGVHAEAYARRDPVENRRLLGAAGLEGAFFHYVGSDYPHKNLRLLLAAHARLRASWPDAGAPPSLAICGHPSGSAGGCYAELGARPPPGVHYLGDVSNEVLKALTQEALALVYVSAYEGFGLPLLEAMAAGLPAICARLSSVPEVAGDAALYLEEPSDGELSKKMFAVATRPELRRRLADAGNERVQRFTWAEMARKTFAVYERALAAPSARSLHERRVAARVCETLV